MSGYLEDMRETAISLLPIEIVEQPEQEQDNLPEKPPEQINLEEVWEEATRHFTHRPDLRQDKPLGDGSHEIFEMDGATPGHIEYDISRPLEGVQFVPAGVSSMTYAECRVRFHPDSGTSDHEELLHQVARDTETEILEINEPNYRHFPHLPAKFYIEPDSVDQIPQAHDEAAKLLTNMYTAFVDALIEDLEQAQYREGAREKDMYTENEEGRLKYNLTSAEEEYRLAANRFISETPNLIQAADHQALQLTEEAERQRRKLE